MMTDSTVLAFLYPDGIDDPRPSCCAMGPCRVLTQAIEAEAEASFRRCEDERLADGRARLVRDGHGPERSIQTGIGPVPIRRAKLRDRGADERSDGERITFTSASSEVGAPDQEPRCPASGTLPARHLDRRLPGSACGAAWKTLSRRSPSVIGRLKVEWQAEYDRWQRRDLSARRYVYIWADGVHPAGAHGRRCRLHAGYRRRDARGQEGACRFPGRCARERAELARVAHRPEDPRPFRGATDRRWRRRHGSFSEGARRDLSRDPPQRCWQHKLLNIFNKVPKSVQPNMKADLREVRYAPDRASAEAAIAVFAEKYGVKYTKAVECLTKDRGALLAFFDFPAEHSDHLRISNPIESGFATVRHRTVRTKGALSADTRPPHGLQARHRGLEDLAQVKGRRSLAYGDRRRQIHRRRRDNRDARSARRLTSRVTEFGYSSSSHRMFSLASIGTRVGLTLRLSWAVPLNFSRFQNLTAARPSGSPSTVTARLECMRIPQTA